MYNAYLQSKVWADRRYRVLRRDNNRCLGCNWTPTFKPEFKYLHIHHLTYDRVFYERLEDLVTLCKDCHKRIHKELECFLGKVIALNLERSSSVMPKLLQERT